MTFTALPFNSSSFFFPFNRSRPRKSVTKLGTQDWLRSLTNIRSALAMGPCPCMLGKKDDSGMCVEWCMGSSDCMGGRAVRVARVDMACL